MGLWNWLTGASRTRVVAQVQLAPGQKLTVRGQGAGLQWGEGAAMKQRGLGTWVWETRTTVPTDCEFKVLINDQTYEEGPNHRLFHGETCTIRPQFPG